jgi:NADH-quinone oxidoreductase subunit J
MLEQIIFWITGLVMVTAAVGVITLKNPINSVISLLVAMFALASFYILMGAYIVALFQIIVYIGAIIVLFLFVVMLLNIKGIRRILSVNYHILIFSALAVIIIAGTICLFWGALQSGIPETARPELQVSANPKALALDIFSRHLLALELTSVLLLVGAVGALLFSRRLRG